MNLKVSKEDAIGKINEQIKNLKESSEINEIKNLLKDTEKELEIILDNKSKVVDFKQKTLYQENEFSVASTKKYILKAKENAIYFLEILLAKIESDSNQTNCKDFMAFSEEIALEIIKRILNNFYFHIEAMYEADVHGKAKITKENLDKIRIGNEYDVQRILYALIKPIFPEARLEVCADTGYGTIRYDIIIEKYNVVIEIKCSRSSMSEKRLSEELGSDAFHYKYANIFFFIYDKDKVVKNRISFIETYNRVSDDKTINAVIVQPIRL